MNSLDQERVAMEETIGRRPVAGDLAADYDRLAWAWRSGYRKGLARAQAAVMSSIPPGPLPTRLLGRPPAEEKEQSLPESAWSRAHPMRPRSEQG